MSSDFTQFSTPAPNPQYDFPSNSETLKPTSIPLQSSYSPNSLVSVTGWKPFCNTNSHWLFPAVPAWRALQLIPFFPYEWGEWNFTRFNLWPTKSTPPTNDYKALLPLKPHSKRWAWTAQLGPQGFQRPRLYPTSEVKVNTELCTWPVSSFQWGRCKTIRICQFHHFQLLISKKTLV